LKTDGPGFSSVYQGTIRFNTYIGVAMSAALFGEAGLTAAAIVIAPLIPLVNVLSVSVLAKRSGDTGSHTVRPLLAIVRNPLILACVTGIALDLFNGGLPPGTATVVDILSRPALPLGLLAVGAGLHLHAAIGRPRLLFTTSGLKLVIMPALAFAAGWLNGLDPETLRALVLFAALPSATSAYILARQMGGDEKLMAALITVQHGLAMLTLPVVVILAMKLSA
jgi:predicted permease